MNSFIKKTLKNRFFFKYLQQSKKHFRAVFKLYRFETAGWPAMVRIRPSPELMVMQVQQDGQFFDTGLVAKNFM